MTNLLVNRTNTMNKKPIIGGIILAAIIGVVFVGAEINPDNPENKEVWSIRMAGPEWDDRQGHRAALPNLEEQEPGAVVFHVTLGDPILYGENGYYKEKITVEEGTYEFRFVPNGDSPQKLSVTIYSQTGIILMDEHFELEGNLVDGGISSWYTWDYLGEKMISFDSSQLHQGIIKIVVNPNGNLNGPVSIELVQIK